jgi:Family of unknown function (DUF6516)
MKAKLLIKTKEIHDDGSIIEMVIWQLPQPTPPSHHSYKYRLYFGLGKNCYVRYDNERGKGDHKHVHSVEYDYHFTSIEQLLNDFENDIKNWSYT